MRLATTGHERGSDTKLELEEFLGQYSNHDSSTVDIPVERLELDAELLDDEEPIVSELLSDRCAWYVASIGCPAEAELRILQWRSTNTKLFRVRIERRSCLICLHLYGPGCW